MQRVLRVAGPHLEATPGSHITKGAQMQDRVLAIMWVARLLCELGTAHIESSFRLLQVQGSLTWAMLQARNMPLCCFYEQEVCGKHLIA